MTRNIVLLITLVFMCLNSFGQLVKPCLFIGTYSSAKGYCGDQVLVQEALANREEYKERELTFRAEHKGFEPSTFFVSEKHCVIITEFKTDRSVFKCNPNPTYYRAFIATTIEVCKRMMQQDIDLYVKNRTVQPKSIFERQGYGGAQKQVITEDFGGVSGKFYLVDKANGGELTYVQFTNNTTDKRAILLLQAKDGELEEISLLPGETLTRKYDTKEVDMQIFYTDSNGPDTKEKVIYKFIKSGIRKLIINEKHELRFIAPASSGIRG